MRTEDIQSLLAFHEFLPSLLYLSRIAEVDLNVLHALLASNVMNIRLELLDDVLCARGCANKHIHSRTVREQMACCFKSDTGAAMHTLVCSL